MTPSFEYAIGRKLSFPGLSHKPSLAARDDFV
jgi:hypothetical protein